MNHIIEKILPVILIISLFSCRLTKKEDIRPWSVRMADSEILRNPEGWMLDFLKTIKLSYCAGLEMESFIRVSDQYDVPAYFDYVLQYADTLVNENGEITSYNKEAYNLDHLNTGKLLFDVYNKTGEEKYKKALYNLRDQLYDHPRTSEGGFWHKLRYPHQMWLDGLYMGAPFYAEFCAAFNEPQYFPDIIRQYQLAAKYTYDPATGLFRHGWDESRQQKWADPVTGQSPHVWGRAMGWFAMSLVDVLDFIPEDQEGRDSIIRILNTVTEGIRKYQDRESGVWYQVIDRSGEEGNYLESTCSAMFVYTLEKASRKGYIEASYAGNAVKGYEGILRNFLKDNKDGTYSITNCCEVAGLGGEVRRDGSYEYYLSEPVRDNDPKAIGPFILVSLQYEKKQRK